MRTRMYGGVRGWKTKIGGKPTFVFLLLDYVSLWRLRVLGAADHSVLLAEEVYDRVDCLREYLAEVDLVA